MVTRIDNLSEKSQQLLHMLFAIGFTPEDDANFVNEVNEKHITGR